LSKGLSAYAPGDAAVRNTTKPISGGRATLRNDIPDIVLIALRGAAGETPVNEIDASYVQEYLAASVAAMTQFAADQAAQDTLASMAAAVTSAMRRGRKLLLAGNGGSAADAQHIAGEFISRLGFDRAPLPAIALTTDTSALTATANDYGFEAIFERQILGLGVAGDVFLAISTTGKSANVLRALDAARAKGLATLGFTGAGGGEMTARCDLLLAAPSDRTPIVQQIHITAAHVLCSLVERAMFPRTAAG
jgi:D-sedoheptulose 7-phosphate isomerase